VKSETPPPLFSPRPKLTSARSLPLSLVPEPVAIKRASKLPFLLLRTLIEVGSTRNEPPFLSFVFFFVVLREMLSWLLVSFPPLFSAIQAG